jgi:hypothetical protein
LCPHSWFNSSILNLPNYVLVYYDWLPWWHKGQIKYPHTSVSCTLYHISYKVWLKFRHVSFETDF